MTFVNYERVFVVEKSWNPTVKLHSTSCVTVTQYKHSLAHYMILIVADLLVGTHVLCWAWLVTMHLDNIAGLPLNGCIGFSWVSAVPWQHAQDGANVKRNNRNKWKLPELMSLHHFIIKHALCNTVIHFTNGLHLLESLHALICSRDRCWVMLQ